MTPSKPIAPRPSAAPRDIQTVAVAGATGQVGREIVRGLLARGLTVRALVRNPDKLAGLVGGPSGTLELRRLELTDAGALRGQLAGVDAVLSALGKTNQRGGAPRRSVDVDANLELLAEASREEVRRFGFVSVAEASLEHPVAMVRMKGEVEHAIEKSGLDFVIVQPTGYFSDLWQLLEMARRGTVWIVGDGAMRFNPIHPRDVAETLIGTLLEGPRRARLPIGGPETFDSHGLVAVCEKALRRTVRTRSVPLWLALAATAAIKPFHEETWQLANFFVGNVAYARRNLGDDASLPVAGQLRLADYFRDRLLEEARSGDEVSSTGESPALSTF
ncbi:MAG: NAD(P)H-binding protein [Acidobacteriota bacterium]